MHYLDAHTHAHFAAFEKDYKDVIGRALAQDVWVVNVGTQGETSRRAVEVAHEFPEGVFATVGLHPNHTGKSFHDAQELGESEAARSFTSRGEEFDPELYRQLAEDPKTLAIGECGLDYFRIEGDEAEAKRAQKEAFTAHMDLAAAVRKPLMIHCRNAFHDLIPMLEERRGSLPAEPGIIHFFTGTPEDARRLLASGFAFTFGGAVTFARNYDEAIRLIPADMILSETDAPYVTPAPHRGKRNEPAYVVEVVKKLAELKGVPVEQMKESIWRNAERILKIS